MDDATLVGLRAALAAAPDNAALRAVIVRALLGAGAVGEAARVAQAGDDAAWPTVEDRRIAAQALVLGGHAERAAELLAPDESPAGLAGRAEALHAAGRDAEALSCLERAVAANPALEDVEFAARLRGRAVAQGTGQGPAGDAAGTGRERMRLRVVDGGASVEPLPEPVTQTVTFADVGGLEDVKAIVRKRIILPFQKPSLFARFKRGSGGGILMYGAPGCGKTLLARATAGECNASFFNVAITDVLDMYLGESESKLHALFEKARASTPAVLFFDEVEALGGKRQYSRDSLSGKVVSQFLAEMDGFAKNSEGVLVMAATNLPWDVDAAFRRPGRFDRFVFVPPPDRAARRLILELQLAGRPVDDKLDLDTLAKRTQGFSGADLKNLVEAATDAAIEATLEQESEVPISMAHLRSALDEVKPTTIEWLATARNHARYANEGGQYDDVLEFLRKHGKE